MAPFSTQIAEAEIEIEEGREQSRRVVRTSSHL